MGKDELTLESLLEPEPPGWLTPYPALNALTKGIRPRQLWLLTAGSGVGKSTDAREWAYKALLDGMKVGMVFLEESVRDTAKHLIALDNDVPASELRDDPTMLTPEQWAKSHNKLIAHGRYLAYDHFGSVDGDNLIGKLTYLAAQGCKLIFVDHISIAVSGLDGRDSDGSHPVRGRDDLRVEPDPAKRRYGEHEGVLEVSRGLLEDLGTDVAAGSSGCPDADGHLDGNHA
nr:DnaB-like helicase C-terminal domain-containing protein [Burkholderia multivorans]